MSIVLKWISEIVNEKSIVCTFYQDRHTSTVNPDIPLSNNLLKVAKLPIKTLMGKIQPVVVEERDVITLNMNITCFLSFVAL